MTLEEAIKNREDCLRYLEGLGRMATPSCVEAVRWSVKALKVIRSVSLKEHAGIAWKAHWIRYEDMHEKSVKYICSNCHDYHAFRNDFGESTFSGNYLFCRRCGCAMTDEAMHMVMERLLSIHDARV